MPGLPLQRIQLRLQFRRKRGGRRSAAASSRRRRDVLSAEAGKASQRQVRAQQKTERFQHGSGTDAYLKRTNKKSGRAKWEDFALPFFCGSRVPAHTKFYSPPLLRSSRNFFRSSR